MALEHRKGGTYYYTKRRIGRRVVSVYQGAGSSGSLLYCFDQLEREREQARRADDREQIRRLAEQAAEIDTLMDDLFRATSALTRAVLRRNGYHQHKGQWRRRRDHI